MPLQETVTIINNSGKIISTGKQLVNIFKEAKASYQEKKASIKFNRSVQRSQTFDVSRSGPPPLELEGFERRRSHDELQSNASSRRSHTSRRSHSGRHREPHIPARSRPALTETNLRSHSEVSATTPSVPPVAYRSPYAETAPRDMALSRPSLARAPTETPVSTPRQSMAVNRRRSDPSLPNGDKEIDMHLAYGNIPPDLATRIDLDPAYQAAQKETRAQNLVDTVEGLLDEAHCVQHSATSIIAHLQNNPEAAAAVALTLAELSSLLTKMSPSFLAMIKGGSPAVFALLASPQFLIGAGVAVGVTVVMFGGWKIIKRIKEANALRQDSAIAMEAMPPHVDTQGYGGVDEALVLEDELSTIESWRRGIAPFGEDESADMELISPEAERAMRRRHRERDPDTASRSGKSDRSSRSHHSSKSHRSTKSRRERDATVPERKSSRGATETDVGSHAGTERSRRTTRSKRSERVELRAIEEGNHAEENALDVVLRPKKGSMLKSLFKKKKDKEDADKATSVVA